MPYPWLDAYLTAKPLAEKEFKSTWNAYLYRLHGKIFALAFHDKNGLPILNLKSDPYLGLLFRQDFPDVQAGYHMNRLHWLSLYLDGQTPNQVVRQLVDNSYELIRAALPRRLRAELPGAEEVQGPAARPKHRKARLPTA